MVAARGFSLIELMVVVVIMGILMAIALPNVNEWIAAQRVRDAADAIHMSLVRARSEAQNRGLAISITPVGGDWKNGWDIPDPANAGEFLERSPEVPNVTISGAGTISFSPVGRLAASAGLKVSSEATGVARCVRVDTAGRPKTTQIAQGASCP